MKIFETERLLFRHLEISDAEDLFRIYSNAEVMKFMGESPSSIETERKNIEAHIRKYYQNGNFGFWATIFKETGEFIGRCGLLQSQITGKDEIEIGYLLDRSFWGKNLATEAACGVLDFAFQQLSLKRVVAVIHPENLASKKVAEKAGMIFEQTVSYKTYPKVLLYAIEIC
jgi:ribosomal-protein-alanine N-acetyltransferase